MTDAPWGNAPWGWGAPPPPQPGVIPLRPLGLGDILGGTMSTVGRNWKAVYGFTLAVMGFALLAAMAAIGLPLLFFWNLVDTAIENQDAPDLSGGAVVATAVFVVAVVLVLVWIGLYSLSALSAGCAVAVSDSVLGKSCTARSLWQRARPRVLSVMGAQLLTGLAVGGLILLAYACFFVVGFVSLGGAAFADEPALGALGFVGAFAILLAAVAGGTYFYIRFSFGASASTLENQPPVAALRRSGHLVKGAWWRVFGILMLVGMITSFINQIIQYALLAVGSLIGALLLGDGGDVSFAAVLVLVLCGTAVLILGSALTTPFPYVAATLIYLDLRIRREGLDLSLAEAAGLPPHRPAY